LATVSTTEEITTNACGIVLAHAVWGRAIIGTRHNSRAVRKRIARIAFTLANIEAHSMSKPRAIIGTNGLGAVSAFETEIAVTCASECGISGGNTKPRR